MGGSIPLPALDVRPPQQTDPVTTYMKLLQVRQMGQQTQATSQENQLRALEIQDQQNMRKLAPSFVQKDDSGKVSGYDTEGYFNGLLEVGVNPTTIAAMRNQYAETSKNIALAGSAQIDLHDKKNDQMYQLLEGVRSVANDKNADPQAAERAYQAALPKLQALGHDTTQYPKTFAQVGTDGLTQFEAGLGVHKQMLADAKEQAETAKATTEALLNQNKVDVINSWKKNPDQVLSQVDSIVPPQGSSMALNARTKSQVWFALRNGDVDGAKAAIKSAADQVGAIEKETNPAVQAAKLHLATATKAAEQAIADGDPKAAAQLLVSGTVAPSQLVSSRKPAFTQQAFSAAAQMQPGWSATKADADYKVASSPVNVAFFGSAKSLTDKGGTLDQLADAAKDIPGNRIPVFNSVADALRASTGSGPIAKYAAIALGVADDYSKVMGGGQGSDTSRTQALQLISAKQSPEQRAGSIEGIRGSVFSQTNSRIGNNAVLQKMYGGQGSIGQTAAPSGPPVGATQPSAQTHSFSLSAWQRANPMGDPNAAKAAAQARGYQVIP